MTALARDVFAPVELPSHYAKALVAILTAALAVLVTALDDSIITAVEGAHIGLAVLTAIGVYLVPNLPTGVGRYAKALVAVAGAGLQAAVPLLTDGDIATSDGHSSRTARSRQSPGSKPETSKPLSR